MNRLEKGIENMVSRTVDESKDLVDDVVDDMVDDMRYDGDAGIKDMCFHLYDLIEDQVNDELEDGEDVSDEVESDTFQAVKAAIKRNKEKIDNMVRCALHELEV